LRQVTRPSLIAFAAAGLAAPWLFGCSSPGMTSCANDFDFLAGEIGCPASFDGTASQLPACRPSDGYNQTVWSCDVIYLHTGTGTTEGDCYYDDVRHALVGVRRYATATGFCDGGSLTESAGRQPQTCPQAPALDQFCAPF
jgi:hypothetical protein